MSWYASSARPARLRSPPAPFRYHSDAHLYSLRVHVTLATGLSSDQRLITSDLVRTLRAAGYIFPSSFADICLMVLYCSLMVTGNYVFACLFVQLLRVTRFS